MDGSPVPLGSTGPHDPPTVKPGGWLRAKAIPPKWDSQAALKLEVGLEVPVEGGSWRVQGFTVKLKTEGEPSVEKFQAAMKARHAVPRLKEELKRVLDEHGWQADSELELLALAYLATVRANVNPAHVEYILYDTEGRPLRSIDLVGIHEMLSHDIDEAKAEIDGVVMNYVEKYEEQADTILFYSHEKAEAPISLWFPLRALERLVKDLAGKPVKIKRKFSMSELLDSLKTTVIDPYIESVIEEDEYRKVLGLLDEAAWWARDPDVKELTVTLKATLKDTRETLKYLSNVLGELSHDAIELDRNLRDPGKYREASELLAGKLAATSYYVEYLEDKIEQVNQKFEAIMVKLREKSIFLDKKNTRGLHVSA